MNLNALHTFLAIVDTGSLIKAAHQLNVTQSTVTARLKTLEAELGQPLLNRHKTGVTLTPSGNRLLRYARVMTGLWQQAQFETRLPQDLDMICTFGCLPELWDGLGQSFFTQTMAAREDMAVSVRQGSARTLDDWLSTGQVDVIMTFGSAARGSERLCHIATDDLILYGHRPDLSTQHSGSYVFVDHGAEFRRHHAEAYHDAGVAKVSFNRPDWALSYILTAGGSAYLPQRIANSYVQSGRLYPLKAPRYQRKINLVMNARIAQNWDWLEGILTTLRQAYG